MSENFAPEQELVFVLGCLPEQPEKVVHGLALLFGGALFDDQIRRVLQKGEPQTLEHCESDLVALVVSRNCDWVACHFGGAATVLVRCEPVLRRVQIHTFLVFPVEVVAFLLDKVVNELGTLESVCAGAHEFLGLRGLLREALVVETVLVEAVHHVHKVILQQLKVVRDRPLQCLERLLDKLLLCVLSRKSKNVDDDFPARLDERRLRFADARDARHYELLDLTARVHVVQHNLLKRPQKGRLESKGLELVTHQKFVRQLPQTVDGENGDHQVLVGTHMHEVLAQHFPNLAPYKANAHHVQVRHLDQRLQ